MNAVVQPARWLHDLREADLDAVLHIESAVYEFPWTRGNFLDSIRSGYVMQALSTHEQGITGYFVVLDGADELHLLNLSVAPHAQSLGHARFMLDALRALAGQRRCRQMWLEVRASNQRARSLYEKNGFRTVGVRRDYYPAADSRREDAVVMSLSMVPHGHG